ncbi:MAG: hypothetical protein JWR54_927 [Mucilaginibacter sp.]|nr:hypothetical protein [Mucilaginibacter sp.]
MKQHLLILSAFLFTLIGSATAQTGKGNYYIGGSLYYNYDGRGTTTLYTYPTGTIDYTVNNLTTFQFNPEFGYFLSKNWAIGIQPNYSRTSGTETSVFTSNNTNVVANSTSTDNYHFDVVGLTVSLRYYYMLTDKIGIFPQFGLSSQNDLKDFSNGEITLLASPNIVFFATPKLGVNMGFGNVKYATDYHFNNSYVNVGFNNAISFGLNYYWGKK